MRIFVTGRDGQVARCLADVVAPDLEFVFAARPQLDLGRPETIAPAVDAAFPDAIVSAAAYTAVDKAEDESDLAMQVNCEGPAELARVAKARRIPILHLSTDYVFDGSLDRPYKEEDRVCPLGVYGTSKLAGEEAVRASGADHIILRTAWVYSPYGQNFVKTMLRLAGERETLSVVADQVGCPTSAHDIAFAISSILVRPGEGLNQTYHFAGTGETNWAGFAQKVFDISGERGGATAQVQPISTSDYPTRAARPKNSRLDCTRFEKTFHYRAPHWESSLEEVVKRLLP